MANQKTPPQDRLVREPRGQMPLGAANFKLMAIAGAMIVIGFLLMAGGSSGTETFNPDIFSPRRIIVGPAISFIGFLFMGFAIMYKGKRKENQ